MERRSRQTLDPLMAGCPVSRMTHRGAIRRSSTFTGPRVAGFSWSERREPARIARSSTMGKKPGAVAGVSDRRVPEQSRVVSEAQARLGDSASTSLPRFNSEAARGGDLLGPPASVAGRAVPAALKERIETHFCPWILSPEVDPTTSRRYLHTVMSPRGYSRSTGSRPVSAGSVSTRPEAPRGMSGSGGRRFGSEVD
jgi:hypothetical protein